MLPCSFDSRWTKLFKTHCTLLRPRAHPTLRTKNISKHLQPKHIQKKNAHMISYDHIFQFVSLLSGGCTAASSPPFSGFANGFSKGTSHWSTTFFTPQQKPNGDWCGASATDDTQGTGAEMPKVNGAKSDPTAAPAFRRVSPVVGWLLGSCLSVSPKGGIHVLVGKKGWYLCIKKCPETKGISLLNYLLSWGQVRRLLRSKRRGLFVHTLVVNQHSNGKKHVKTGVLMVSIQIYPLKLYFSMVILVLLEGHFQIETIPCHRISPSCCCPKQQPKHSWSATHVDSTNTATS